MLLILGLLLLSLQSHFTNLEHPSWRLGGALGDAWGRLGEALGEAWVDFGGLNGACTPP